jgi:tetratricopeptide (TPR) repeat protein
MLETTVVKRSAKVTRKPASGGTPAPAGTSPWYRNPLWWLMLITCILYARTLTLDFTRLDDSIFIIENEPYNKGFGNLGTSFQRGLFHPTEDVYYRPLFLVDFIIESKIFGNNPAGYHFTNLLFHLLSVALLYLFLRKLKIPAISAFLLSMIFAVHPVLSQAVAWIPGRNDMLLMIFFLSGMIVTINWTEKPGPGRFAAQAVLFLLALFTKETAVIIPVIMAAILLFYFRFPWKRLLPLAAGWGIAILFWFLVRASATLAQRDDLFSDMARSAAGRLPAILQYLGKIFFPFNLTVFPVLDQITLLWGILAFILLTALIIVSKNHRHPLTWIGLFWFLVFLLPVLIVPKSLNDQVFEHRLYIPLIGILLMLSPALAFSDHWPEKRRLLVVGLIGLGFAGISFVRTGYYADPLTFWTKAVEGTPRSSYARMLLGTKVATPAEREKLFLEAWALDSTQANLNYYLGKVMAEKKSFDSAAFFLQKEVGRTRIPDVYFLLAQLAYMKNRHQEAAGYLERVVEMDPLHPQANPNLALVYIQLGQKEKAVLALDAMKLKGMQASPDLVKMVEKLK